MQYCQVGWHLSLSTIVFFNVSGKAGGNIPLDLRMEHLNKLLKTALKQLGSNISEDAAQRIARALTGLERLISNVDTDCNLTGKRGYHNAKQLKETVIQITQDLLSEEAFDCKPGRKYQCFKNFKSDLLDHREFFSWGRRLFKVWEAMYYEPELYLVDRSNLTLLGLFKKFLLATLLIF